MEAEGHDKKSLTLLKEATKFLRNPATTPTAYKEQLALLTRIELHLALTPDER